MTAILAIETSTDFCSVALLSENKWHSFHQSVPRQHAAKSLEIVQSLLTQANIRPSDLDLLVYGRGPGSFTGLRIAAGVAQGLSLANHIPVIGVSTLTSVAMGVTAISAATSIICCLDARMSQVYWCHYALDQTGLPVALQQEMVTDPEQVVKSIDPSVMAVAGNGWQCLQTDETSIWSGEVHSDINPDARDMIRWVLAAQPEPDLPGEVSPVYIRDKVTWNQKPKIGSL